MSEFSRTKGRMADAIRPFFDPRSGCGYRKPALSFRVVNQDLLPVLRALVAEAIVNRVHLIAVVRRHVPEDDDERVVVAAVDDGAIGGRRDADVAGLGILDSAQRLESFDELVAVGRRQVVLEPEV